MNTTYEIKNSDSSTVTNSYGLAYQTLQTKLAKQCKYAELRLSTYLSARMNVPGWTFSAADIIEQTGISKTSTYTLCNELVEAGIFSVKQAKRGCATIYNFDKVALSGYLKGSKAIDGIGKQSPLLTANQTSDLPPTRPAVNALPDQSLVRGVSTVNALPDQSLVRGVSTVNALPDQPLATITKMEKEDENEYIQSNRACVCISQTEAAGDKADSFIKQAKALQTSNPEYRIIIKSNAHSLLVDLFDAQPDLTVKELSGEWLGALDSALLSKVLIKVDDPSNYAGTKLERGEYDEAFWVKRSCDLSFFLKNRENVLAYLDSDHE